MAAFPSPKPRRRGVPHEGGAVAPIALALDPRDIRGALGTIAAADQGVRGSWRRRFVTLMAILGPGLIVMVGDNDAGAFATYGQAGQTYGTAFLWTLLLLVPVLYVNQEMVLRLGAVTGVGHARLIFARFGRFWGAFSVIDLFVLNALTIVTEFIGISLALGVLGISRGIGVPIAAVLTIAAAMTGDFRRFERLALALCAGSLLLVPLFVLVHPPLGGLASDLVRLRWPGGPVADSLLLVIAIVGTTVAPWQLFFQQSYVIDKRITPRFLAYGKADLWLGIVVVVIGAVMLMAASAAAFAGSAAQGHFTDAAGRAAGFGAKAGRIGAVLFALALLDASVIGAAAVSLSTAYALGDVLRVDHSLHRRPREAIGFYLVYGGLIALAAWLVLLPGAPLGLITEGVQTLAGVLLPGATVFLLLLCNDAAVLGPWTNGRWRNAFTALVLGVLVLLSVVLTASVLFPAIGAAQILAILGGGAAALVLGAVLARPRLGAARPPGREGRATWRMAPIESLPPPTLGRLARFWLGLLRAYLAVAVVMVAVRLVLLALGAG